MLPSSSESEGSVKTTMEKRRDSSRRPTPLPAREALGGVPYRNEAMQLTQRRDGTALATIPMRKPRYLVPPISWVVPFSSSKRVELDPIGLSVLEMCDGSRTIESIIETFAANHKLSFREGQLAIMQFLKQLSQRGIVAIVGLNQRTGEQ